MTSYCQCNTGESKVSKVASAASTSKQKELQDHGVMLGGDLPPTQRVIRNLGGNIGGFPVRTAIGPPQSQSADAASMHHKANDVCTALLIMFCSHTQQDYQSDEEVTSKRRHIVIDLLSEEESEAVDEDDAGELGIPGDDDACEPPPQPDQWDPPTVGGVGQLLAQLAEDFAADLDAAFPNFMREARICLGTDSPYLGSPRQPPTSLWVDDPRLFEYSSMSEGYPEVSEGWGDEDGDEEEREDMPGSDWDLAIDECESGEVMEYHPEGDQTPMNVEEPTTDGDYPSTPRSVPECTVDEELTSTEGESIEGGNGDGWNDESSDMWSWLATDSDTDEDDLSDPDYTG